MEAVFFEYELEVIVLDDTSVVYDLSSAAEERAAEACYMAWFTDWRRRYGLEVGVEA